MQRSEYADKLISEIAKANPSNEKISIKLKRAARELYDQASNEQAGNSLFLDYLYTNYRKEIAGTTAEKDVLKLINGQEAGSASAIQKPSDEVFMKALGADNMKELLDWTWHNHWSKMPIDDFQARAAEAGIDPSSLLAWVNQQQVVRDRQMVAEGYDPYTGNLPRTKVLGMNVPNPLPWLGSAAMGLMAPRTKEAIAQGREPTVAEQATDIAVNAAQALPFGTFYAPVSRAGQLGMALVNNASVPVAEEIADYFTSEDPYRKKISIPNAVLGSVVNLVTPGAIRVGTQALGEGIRGFGKNVDYAKAIENFVTDPIEANKAHLKKAQEIVDRGMAPEGSGFVNPELKKANAQEYEDALDVLVLDELRKKGFFVPEMSDPEARKKLVKDLLVRAEQDPEIMLKSDITRRGLRGIGKEAPGTYAETKKSGEFVNPLDERFYSVNPSYSSVYAASKEARAKEGKDLANLGPMEEFGTVLVDGKPRLAIFDQSIEPSLGNTSRIENFKRKYGYDPEERHFSDKKRTAAAQFEASDPLYEGADVLSNPTDFDKALGTVLEKPENQRLAFYGGEYRPTKLLSKEAWLSPKGSDRSRLGLIALGTNKLGKSENAKRIPFYGSDIYNLVEKDISTKKQEKTDVDYYLNDPYTIKQWEAGFKPRPVNGEAMIKAYEIWKASKEKGE